MSGRTTLKIILAVFLACAFAAVPARAEEWKEYTRRHFIIYYKEAPYDFVEEVNRTAEEYYREITENLGFTRYKGWNWEDRAKIYIYDDAEDYKESARQAGWSSGAASPRSKTIRTFPAAAGFFDSTLPHELGHIIFREFVGFDAQVPVWFEEGVAMYQEKAKRWGAHEVVREAMDNGRFIPLEKLTITYIRNNSSRKLVDLFYAESASVVNFMINELGEQRFVYLCRKLKEGRPFSWTLDSVYTRIKDIDGLNEAWVKYLKNG